MAGDPCDWTPLPDHPIPPGSGQSIIRDVTVGVNETGVRAGLIGEIGTSSPVTENEEKSLRASAR